MHLPIKLVIAVAIGVSLSYTWHIDGTVSSSKGGPVADVAISVEDSAHIASVFSDNQGHFSIDRQPVTSILSRDPLPPPAQLSQNGSIFLIEISQPGSETQTLFNLAGKRLESNASPHASTPRSSLARQQALLQQPIFPQLRFHKTGYQDTLYTMTSDIMTGVQISLRDTTTPVVACPTPALGTGEHRRNITVSGQNRSYLLRVPANYPGNRPVPMLVDYHPLGGSGSGQMGSSPYKNQTDPEGVITAYPDGLSGPSGGAWNVGPCCVGNANDTAFARALVEDAKRAACIDPKRIYAAGFSMGGGMSHYSACHLSDLFAAVAPAAFDLLEENQNACRPSRPIPVISFRSTGDFVVNYNGGASAAVQGMPVTFLGALGTHRKWAQINSCTGEPGTDANGCSTYSSCSDGVKVTLCTRQGGGHDQGNAQVGWPWLKQFTLP